MRLFTSRFVISFILLCIVVGALWFVNSEWQSLKNIGQEPRSGQEKTTTPSFQDSPKNSWSFAVIGDTEDVRPINEKMIEDIRSRSVAFVVHVGDISSHGETEKMQAVLDLFATLPFPTYYVPGNNDLVYDETIERKTLEVYNAVVGSNTYSAIDYQNAHIVLLDNSYRRIGFSDEELAWLQQDLQKNTQPYTFLFYHRPVGLPGEEWIGDDETPDSRIQNQKFVELIGTFPITHIFNGHIHTTLSYTLNSIPVTITGGGGAIPQDILGGEDAALYHYYIVTVPENPAEEIDMQLVTF